MSDKKDNSGLSAEDLELWQRVTQTTAPLKKRPSEAPPIKTTAKTAAKTLAKEETLSNGPPKTPAPRRHRREEPPRAVAAPLTAGKVAGLDKRNAERLRKGQMPIEGRLDLHGLTQEQAHRALDRFLAEAARIGKRCILVITGKGRGTDGGITGEGVLRKQVPRWLNQPENRSKIVSFTHAQAKDGGNGALYVLLKRIRR